MFVRSSLQVRTGTITQERQSSYTLTERFIARPEKDVQRQCQQPRCLNVQMKKHRGSCEKNKVS